MSRTRASGGFVVHVGANALMHTVLAAVEAYVVPHADPRPLPRTASPQQRAARTRKLRNPSVETYGLLWGHARRHGDRTLYSVETATVDTSAGRAPGHCVPNPDALSTKRAFVAGFWPSHEFLGDFHTHPYPRHAVGAIERARGYQFSETDRKSIAAFGEDYRVGVVLAITHRERRRPEDPAWLRGHFSTIRFSMGNYLLWLGAQVVTRDAAGQPALVPDGEVVLDCPALVGLTEIAHIGRVRRGPEGMRHEPGG